MPRFAHLSLLLKPVGNGKLSKRDGDKMGFPVFPLRWTNPEGETSRGYREDGYFPEAFVNMLAMLGWNPGDDREMFTMEELIGAFSLDKVQKAGAKFNPEKAKWYNREYLRLKSDEELTDLLVPILEGHGINVIDCPKCALTAGAEFNVAGGDLRNHIFTRDYVQSVVSFTKERATFVNDFWTIASYLFVAPRDFERFGIKAGAAVEQTEQKRPVDPRAKVYDDTLTAPYLAKDVDKFWKPEIVEMVLKVGDFIKGFDGEWTVEEVEKGIEEFIKGNEWPMGKVMNAIRLALAGSASGLGIADIVARIGKKETAARLESAVSRLNS